MPAKALAARDVALPRFTIGAPAAADTFALSSHKRAREALEMALGIRDPGFNLFVLGEDRSGRMTATLQFLRDRVSHRPTPSDWIYLNNFRSPNRPRPYRLPAGTGRAFRSRMAALVPELRESLTRAFGADDYQAHIRSEGARVQNPLRDEMEALRTEARERGLDIVQTQQGPAVAAVGQDGQPIPLDAVPAELRDKTAAAAEEIGKRLAALSRQAAELQGEFARKLVDINRQVADEAVHSLIDTVAAAWAGHAGLARWFVELRNDIIDNLAAFLSRPDSSEQLPERRYAVNLLVEHGDEMGPEVVLEANPTYENLFGRIEYRPVEGGLETDFTMIRAGALHRANGGVLVLRAEALAGNPVSWQFLKGALRDGHITTEELHRTGAMPLAGAPQPIPIPLDVKVVIVGAPRWYYAFFSTDPDFQTYFKIKADIDPDMDANPANVATYSGLIRGMAENRTAAGVDDAALVRLLGLASRWAAHREKLTARFEMIEDVVAEAAEIEKATNGDGQAITDAAVVMAMERRRRRNARVEDRMQEDIARGTLMIDTAGTVVGQVNALTVRDLGDHRFGAPARVTARASIGRLGIINIERDVELGGPIQQKGVMVLQGFLAGHFARRYPLSFNCSITFEQSYGGVEGDSASLAELLAVLSDLAGVPVRQDLAITGSVNQLGESQAVGGVHHKVEGFFRTCVHAGLTGEQGVAVPAANEANLVLRDDVAEAVDAGKFHIWSVRSIEEAIALFTGLPAGVPDRRGDYPSDTVYGRVTAQIEAFDAILKERGHLA